MRNDRRTRKLEDLRVEASGQTHVLAALLMENRTTLATGDEPQPWLRWLCSCGRRANDQNRYTIEENAHWNWTIHRDRELAKEEHKRQAATAARQALIGAVGVEVPGSLQASSEPSVPFVTCPGPECAS